METNIKKNGIRLLLLFFLAAPGRRVFGQVVPTGDSLAPALIRDQMPTPGTSSPTKINYLRTKDFQEAVPYNSFEWDDAQYSPISTAKETSSYLDNLGREMQTVNRQLSPDGKDIVSQVFYDQLGRVQYRHLPFASDSTRGKFVQSFLHEQYNKLYPYYWPPNTPGGDQIFYSETEFESSPMNRPLLVMPPGNAWTGAGRGTEYDYQHNTNIDSVRIWKTNASTGSLPQSTASYPDATLYRISVADEGGHKSITYKDQEGRVILKKQQISGGIMGDYNGYADWLCTYYVYDDFGRLRYVIPPLAVRYLLAHNWTMTQTISDELCFYYEYDGRGRMTVKKNPGAAVQYFVYDQRDRLVMSQDGKQRQAHQWLVIYYDAQDRVVKTALLDDPTASRQSLQNLMDSGDSSNLVVDTIPAPTDMTVNSRAGNTPGTYVARGSITFLPGFESGANDNFTAYIDPDAVAAMDTMLYVDATNPTPHLPPAAVTTLSQAFYDDYTWHGHLDFNQGWLDKAVSSEPNAEKANPFQNTNSYSRRTNGLVTGSRTRVLNPVTGGEQWLTSTAYYDERGRVIQTLTENITGGIDAVSTQYDFSGKVLSTYTVNHNNQSALTPETRVLTQNHYDMAGRLLSVSKKLNDAGQAKVIVQNNYDELGKLKTKILAPGAGSGGGGLETLTYDYNVRDWLKGINRWYAEGKNNDHFFGMELNYDRGFSQNQYNGNIAGEQWRTSGDGERRAYGFTYDAANRLTQGDFTQYTGGWNTSAGVDYTVSNLAYDANGNIKSMKQKGLIGTSSGTVDDMAYHYLNSENSNRLGYVNDPNGTTAALGDFKDGHTGSGDYTYDTDGNLTKDLNKGINAITYNYLNLPETVSFGSKGNIRFVYDAAGNKLQKVVTDKTQAPNIVTTTNYVDGFIYQHIGSTAYDTLQFFPTEEGRVRYVPAHGTTAAAYAYDYFLKDHLGNTRVVLTEQTDFTQYMATMEQPNAQAEDALFYNLDNTREVKPPDYPEDNTTTPNAAVAKLNGDDPNKRIGPSIILKVMAGDTIQAGVRAFYRQQATPKNNAGLPAEQMLSGLVQALVAPATQAAAMHNMRLAVPEQATGPGLTANDLQSLKQKDPNNINSDKPKAYLNYVFFDKQFKFVDDGSGVKQVDGEPGQLETLSSGKVVAQKNGYVYVYTSNESQQDVLFDNMGVEQISGPVLEETHYYPFGLTMAGISTTAPLKLETKRKFNGIDFNHKEFSDGSGLDLYTAKFRGLDPQIGRWWQIDPKPNTSVSPYAAMDLNPILNMDFLGDTIINNNGEPVSYVVNKDNNVKWSKGTSKDIQTIGNAMAKTEKGRNTLNKMKNAKYGVYLSINTKDVMYGDKNGNITNKYTKGTQRLGGYTEITVKNGKVVSANITIYQKTAERLSSAPDGFIRTINISGKTVYTSKYTLNENIGAISVHEGTHATDPNSMRAFNAKNTEKLPYENELKYYEELNPSNVIDDQQ